ncbi:MAG: hypothetical protein ACJ0RF_00010 [Luminiphilus sp.]|jgi:hypothetical protein
MSKKFLLEDPALNWKTFLRVIGVCLAAYLFMNLGTQAIKDYSDPAAIAIIFVSILVICGVLRIHNQAPVAPIMYALGTPLGLLCVSLGVWAIFWGWDGDAGIELLGFNTTLILLPALMGGAVSGLGYLWMGSSTQQMPKSSWRVGIFFALFLLLTVTFIVFELGVSLLGWETEIALILGLIAIVSFVSSSADAWVKRVAHSTMFVVLIVAFLGIIDLAVIGANTGYANVSAYAGGMSKIYISISTGLVVYLLCIIWSIAAGAFDDIDFGKLNWHLIEAFSLIVLITISPPSIYHFMS